MSAMTPVPSENAGAVSYTHLDVYKRQSLGSFSSRFTEIVGVTPSQYRERDHSDLEVLPACVSMYAMRPQRTTVTA